MFAARGLVVSFSVFVIVYTMLSLAVRLVWRSLWRYSHSQRCTARWSAHLLFALRMSPLVAAAVVTAAVTVPSFLLLEPRGIDEPVGTIPLVLSACGAALGVFGVLNVGMAMRRASRAISLWTRAAQPVKASAAFPVLRIPRAVPAMVAAGIVRRRILLSDAAESALTAGELEAALDHEVAHVRQHDNLKKLLLRLLAFPGMGGLEAVWVEASEMAADEAAVSTPAEALDLAAALIKLSRLAPACSTADLTAALVHNHGAASAMNARVERLIGWSERRNQRPRQYSPWYGLAAAVATVAVFSVTYNQLLVHVHTATEWLVR
jgi:beta-lactamase regulating signal transducer with metallopeptidase domain